ncbi:Ebp2-domain-containing protein [Tilletiaria anomala UBC 951]|uniref:Ebp2-domain-containing protein n=1 Tax=Tilletiaria anomala (strain ATCC 24038 / CBS 436.72 / UBC 951) TaxID=1037660 RepID=A0A066VDM6_TILAU|nr:Ebp2-domain-containing protein [Tilletiaria anomala UBC 951]KDN36834.1 Ebp2-domain-containing protein [Tilletiaria anomala UBC 951]
MGLNGTSKKGKAKAVTPAAPVLATLQPSKSKKISSSKAANSTARGNAQDDESDDDDYQTTSDEDNEDSEDGEDDEEKAPRDVSKKGLKRLLAALEREGLDEFDAAMLQAAGGQKKDHVEKHDEEDKDDAEMDESDQEELPILAAKGDSLAASILRSGLIPQQDDDEDEVQDEEFDDCEDEWEQDGEDVLLEDLGDTDQLPEALLATKRNRVRTNNKEALQRVLAEFRLSGEDKDKLPWVETMDITWDQDVREQVGENVEDDLKREVVFYKQSLYAAVEARKRATAAGMPFTRPADFFAEMVKTDEHMERVRQKLLDERAGIKASEEAKKQRELKKFGKKVQVEKLLERQKRKKELADKVKGLRQRHGGGGDDNDGFDIQLEDTLGESTSAKSPKDRRKLGKGKDGRAKMPRTARDAKYGFGGKKRYSKENTAASTNDFDGGPAKKRRISGTAGFRKPAAKKSRPGKSKRAGGARR